MGVEARPRSRQHQCLSLVPDKFEWKEARAGGLWRGGRGRLPAGTMAGKGDQLVLTLLLLWAAAIEATQKVNTTEIRLESGSGLKNYEEEEEGTVLPYRRKNKEYTAVMLERERKTTEIWKQNHTRASGGVQKLDSVA